MTPQQIEQKFKENAFVLPDFNGHPKDVFDKETFIRVVQEMMEERKRIFTSDEETRTHCGEYPAPTPMDYMCFPEPINFLTPEQVTKFKIVLSQIVLMVEEYEKETGIKVNSFNVNMDETRTTP